jgi:chorismate mutase
MTTEEAFVLVQLHMLPDAIRQTLEAKKLLETGTVATVQEAVEHVGISRSSFYKYKDSVFPFNEMSRKKMLTLSMILTHRAGVLSHVLQFLAGEGANVLTINQTIPLQGEATVSMSVDTVQVKRDFDEVLAELKELPGVSRAAVVGSGE